jgi:stage IV sporulation protein FB
MFGDKRWYLFSVMGNKVYMTLSFLIIMVLFAGMGVQTGAQLLVGLLWVPVLFIGILLHELGHAFASKKLGYGHSEIVFWGLGGLAINRYSGKRSHVHQILISLAGPLVSGLLALASLGVLFALEGAFTSTGYFGKFWELMVMANGFWAIFNLIPIHPMDGGQAMGSALQMGMKNRERALRTTGIISIVMIVAMLAGSAFIFRQTPGIWLLLLSAYFAYLNWKMIQTAERQSFY